MKIKNKKSKIKNWLPLLLLCLLLPPGCTVTPEGIQQTEVPLEDVLPPSQTVASYRQLKKPVKLSGEELETQFGGAQKLAVLRQWGVVSSLYADYGLPGRPPKARVSVTEMDNKQNAYGAYTNVRPGLLNETDYIKIGVHATVAGDRLLFVQDHFLMVVRDLSDDQDPARRAMLINFARAISDRIPRDITDIELIGYLPLEDRIPATERLDKEDPLGLGLLKSGGVTALYRIEDRECKVFMGKLDSHSSVRSLLKDVKLAAEKEGPVTELSIGDEGYQGRLFKKPAMLARQELVVFGCYGTLTEKEMHTLMATIARRVKPYIPPKAKPRKDEDGEAAKNKLN